MSDFRLQFRRSLSLMEDEDHVEGEPFWDAAGRRLGFWDPDHNTVTWFRIPKFGEGEDYIPLHQIDQENHAVRFMQQGGQWGDWIYLAEEPSITVGTTPPADPEVNQLWVDTN